MAPCSLPAAAAVGLGLASEGGDKATSASDVVRSRVADLVSAQARVLADAEADRREGERDASPGANIATGRGIQPEILVDVPETSYKSADPTWERAVRVLREEIEGAR